MKILEEARAEIFGSLYLFEKVDYPVEGIGEADKFLCLMDDVLRCDQLDSGEYAALEEAYDRLTRAWRKIRKGAKRAGLQASELWQKAAVAAGLREHPLWKRSVKLSKKLNKVRASWQAATDKGDKRAMDRHQAALFGLQNRQDRILKALQKHHKTHYPKVLNIGGEG